MADTSCPVGGYSLPQIDLTRKWTYNTSLTCVGSSFIQSIPMGSGGIQWMTISRFSELRGPVQYRCQWAERTWGRGEACCEPLTAFAEYPPALNERIALETLTPTSQTRGSEGPLYPPLTRRTLRTGLSISGSSLQR